MDRKITMYTLAKELNLSTAAISRAFNPDSKLSAEKRKLILETARRMRYEPNNMASRLSQTPIRIGVLIYGYMAVYDNEIIAGIESSYKELRGFKVTCDLKVLKNDEKTMESALSVLDEFQLEGYDGVLISKLPEKVVRDKIDEMADKGIKVVIFDSDIPQSGRLFVSMNNISVASSMVAQLLKMFLGQREGNIAVFKGGDQEKLISLFYEHAQEHGLKIASDTELVVNVSDSSKKKNIERVGKAFSKNTGINGIYVSCANCLPVCEYLVTHGLEKKVVLITSDIFDEMRPYIESGVIDASIYQNPYAQGHDAFERLYYHIAEKKDVPEQLLAHPQVIMKSNMMLF